MGRLKSWKTQVPYGLPLCSHKNWHFEVYFPFGHQMMEANLKVRRIFFFVCVCGKILVSPISGHGVQDIDTFLDLWTRELGRWWFTNLQVVLSTVDAWRRRTWEVAEGFETWRLRLWIFCAFHHFTRMFFTARWPLWAYPDACEPPAFGEWNLRSVLCHGDCCRTGKWSRVSCGSIGSLQFLECEFFIYPLVNIQKAIENCHLQWWFTHIKWWFSIVTLVYQRVSVIIPYYSNCSYSQQCFLGFNPWVWVWTVSWNLVTGFDPFGCKAGWMIFASPC